MPARTTSREIAEGSIHPASICSPPRPDNPQRCSGLVTLVPFVPRYIWPHHSERCGCVGAQVSTVRRAFSMGAGPSSLPTESTCSDATERVMEAGTVFSD